MPWADGATTGHRHRRREDCARARREPDESEDVVKANVGDRLIQESAHVDDPRRIGVIVEVHHADGTPPYLIRWQDGHESLVSPGPDARIESK